MTPDQLAAEVEAFVAECQERVTGVGATQYYEHGKPQKFETMALDDRMEYAEDALRDLVVYAVMTRIRFRRLREAVRTGHRSPPN